MGEMGTEFSQSTSAELFAYKTLRFTFFPNLLLLAFMWACEIQVCQVNLCQFISVWLCPEQMLTLDITITHSAVPPTEDKHKLCNSFMRNNNRKLPTTSKIQVRTISRSCSALRLQWIFLPIVHTVQINSNNCKSHNNALIYLMLLHCRSRPCKSFIAGVDCKSFCQRASENIRTFPFVVKLKNPKKLLSLWTTCVCSFST